MKKLLCSLAVVVALACTTSVMAQDAKQKKEATKTEVCCKKDNAKKVEKASCCATEKADKKASCCKAEKSKKAENASCCKKDNATQKK